MSVISTFDLIADENKSNAVPSCNEKMPFDAANIVVHLNTNIKSLALLEITSSQSIGVDSTTKVFSLKCN